MMAILRPVKIKLCNLAKKEKVGAQFNSSTALRPFPGFQLPVDSGTLDDDILLRRTMILKTPLKPPRVLLDL